MSNKNMHAAKKAKNDEFYTPMGEICAELAAHPEYVEFFRGKHVFLNCDDPQQSNFWKFFSLNFMFLGLKQLTSTHYDATKPTYRLDLYADLNNDGIIDDKDLVITPLQGNGDFRNQECIDILKQCDVVVTNPPFSCYSFDTEVLTNSGWKFIKDVDINQDTIYSLNPQTNEIEIVKAIDFIKSPVNGGLLHFHNLNMDFMVTSNHKMYSYYRNCNGESILMSPTNAEDIKKSNLLKLTGFNWVGKKNDIFILPSVIKKQQYSRKEITIPEKKIDMKSFLEFFGFWLADGCCRLGNNSQGNPRYTVSVKQNISREDYVKKLFSNIGFDCRVESRKDGNNNYVVYNKQLWEYLKQFGKSHEKFIPREFLELDKEYLQCLFRGYINGDSHGENEQLILSSVSKKLMDSLQEIILKLYGQISRVRVVNATYRNKPYKYYMISLTKDLKHRSFSKYGVPDKVKYNDYVYCLTLEKNHIMLVRHNGVIGWCGNCFREYIEQLFTYNKKFVCIANMNSITYKEIFNHVMQEEMWPGYGFNKTMEFMVPDGYKFNREENGIKYAKVPAIMWWTNIDLKKRHIPLLLCKEYIGNESEYPMYDNYNAIECGRVCDIPNDYLGYMGVPITYLGQHCPNQFEIIGLLNSSDKDLAGIQPTREYDSFYEIRQDGTFTKSSGKKTNGNPVLSGKPSKGNYYINKSTNECVHSAYARIIIKQK